MSQYHYEKICRHTAMIREYLDSIEESSRLSANSDQPIVGPPSVSSDSPALARPVMLSEARAFIRNELDAIERDLIPIELEQKFGERRYRILQYLSNLDQGPAAKNSLEEICSRLANQPDDPNAVDL